MVAGAVTTTSAEGRCASPRGPGLTLNRAKALLQELLAGVSSPRFQRKLATVTDAWGRRELLLSVQREVLPQYGYDGSEGGFEEVALALQPFLSDPKIILIAEAITRKLTLPSHVGHGGDGGEGAERSVHSELFVACCTPDFQRRLPGLAQAERCGSRPSPAEASAARPSAAEAHNPSDGTAKREVAECENKTEVSTDCESTASDTLSVPDDESPHSEARRGYGTTVVAIFEFVKGFVFLERPTKTEC